MRNAAIQNCICKIRGVKSEIYQPTPKSVILLKHLSRDWRMVWNMFYMSNIFHANLFMELISQVVWSDILHTCYNMCASISIVCSILLFQTGIIHLSSLCMHIDVFPCIFPYVCIHKKRSSIYMYMCTHCTCMTKWSINAYENVVILVVYCTK